MRRNFPAPATAAAIPKLRLLRERYGFKHELRAAGYVRQDQLFFLARCGFNSFELPENELNAATAAFLTFSSGISAVERRGASHASCITVSVKSS